MAYVTRYQVFLSSTYTDLKEERAAAIQALWELDCIPTGMEAFLASNTSQWDIIRQVIDQCDYYVLLIGGRYGSVTSDGISYTEKEFNYAKKIGLPILAFVHGQPEKIEIGKTDADLNLRSKLEAFRTRVMSEYPIREWTNADQLGALVSRSLVQEMKRTPRPGWIRNDGSSPVALLERIDVLTQENQALKEKAPGRGGSLVPLDQLASGPDKVTLSGAVYLYDRDKGSHTAQAYEWDAETTWDVIFRNVGPLLLSEAAESRIESMLARFYHFEPDYPYENQNVLRSSVDHDTLVSVLIQLRALGLIDKGTKKRGIHDKTAYWQLTEHGDRYLVSLMAKRKDESSTASIATEVEAGQAKLT